MSTVRDYYESHHLSDDPLHKALDSIPALNARLPEIRQQMLGCCGAEPSDDGLGIKLSVADSARWDALAAEQNNILQKIARIEALVSDLDMLFEQAEKEGITIHTKTPRGIQLVEVQWRKDHSTGRTDDWGKPVPTPGDPAIIRLLERANAALAEQEI